MVLISAVESAEPYRLRVCDSDVDYPPFTMVKKTSAEQLRLEGFSVQVLSRVLDPARWHIEWVVLPFNRCIRDTADNSVADMVLTASLNEERQKQFIASDPFWYAHFHAFYLRQRFPNGLPGDHKAALANYKLCGIKGHNISMFELNNVAVDLGSEDYDAVFRKLSLGRCEVFPYNLEVIEGHQLLGKHWVNDPQFSHQEIRDVKPWPFQMLISRRFDLAKHLQADINQALAALWRSGELAALYKKQLSSESSR
jgi:polar amino acid transport system substrate-binding protein